MSKIILNSDQYVFSGSTIVVSGVTITKENLLLITNTTTNKVLYNFACDGFGGTISGDTLTLDTAPVGASDSDNLQILVYQEIGPEAKITESVELNTNRSEALLGEILKSNQEIVKYLRKIYNPE